MGGFTRVPSRNKLQPIFPSSLPDHQSQWQKRRYTTLHEETQQWYLTSRNTKSKATKMSSRPPKVFPSSGVSKFQYNSSTPMTVDSRKGPRVRRKAASHLLKRRRGLRLNFVSKEFPGSTHVHRKSLTDVTELWVKSFLTDRSSR